MSDKTCDNYAFLRYHYLKGRKLYKCINHIAPTKEELMQHCIWKIAERKKGTVNGGRD